MTEKTSSANIRVVQSLVNIFHDFYNNRRGKGFFYSSVFIIALAYAIFNDFVLGKTAERVAYEIAILTTIFIILAPVLADRLFLKALPQRETKLQHEFSKARLGFISAMLLVTLLAGTTYYIFQTMRELKNQLQETQAEIKKHQQVSFELDTFESGSLKGVTIGVGVGETASLFNDQLTIRLVSAKPLNGGTSSVTALISSPGYKTMEIRDQEASPEIIYSYIGKYIIRAVEANKTFAQFFVAQKDRQEGSTDTPR